MTTPPSVIRMMAVDGDGVRRVAYSAVSLLIRPPRTITTSASLSSRQTTTRRTRGGMRPNCGSVPLNLMETS